MPNTKKHVKRERRGLQVVDDFHRQNGKHDAAAKVAPLRRVAFSDYHGYKAYKEGYNGK